MHMILLSGGSGKRLWPLSNDTRSKQFIPLFRREDGSYESMLQRVYRQIMSVDAGASVTIATSRTQASAIRSQLGDAVRICIEPCRRDTFPAIALAAAYLHDEMGVSDGEAVVVCPVDGFVEADYFAALKRIHALAQAGEANLVLMGVEPDQPSEKYGYIIPETAEAISRVRTFREKPDAQTAAGYIAQGALWNGGVFACRLGYLTDKTRALTGFAAYRDLQENYASLRRISFDYAVAESETNARVLRFGGRWADLGTWNALTQALDGATVGNAVMDEQCRNVHVINESDVPVLAMGLQDVVIAVGADGVLVADKERASHIKPYVDAFTHPPMFAEKSWGSYRVLDAGAESLTVRLSINPGQSLNEHSHQHRSERWVVVSGRGRGVVDGVERTLLPGDVVELPVGCRHYAAAETELTLVEVQLGKRISVEDKVKYPR